MQLELQSRDERLPMRAKRAIDRYVRTAMQRFGAQIAAVRIRLMDINGPRGGRDKLCHVVVVLNNGGLLSAKVQGEGYEAAAHRAATRVRRQIAHLAEKRRIRERSQRASSDDAS